MRRAPNKTVEMGLFSILVASPLLFTPFSAAPFVDPKLVLLTVGALLLSLSRLEMDRAMTLLTGAWVLALAVASALGLDPLWSLLGAPNQGMGFIALASSAFLLAAGTGLPGELRRRAAEWLFWTGVVIAAIAVVGRFVDVGASTWRLGSLSATIGHRVFVGGLLAACAVAGLVVRTSWFSVLGFVMLGSGLAVTAVRAAWLGALLGISWALWRGRHRIRGALAVVLPLVVALAGWTVADRALLPESEIEFSAAPRFAQLAEGSAAERPAVWQAYLRAWRHDLIVGSGPSTGWFGYLTNATPSEIQTAGRNYAYAHNLPLEVATTTGLLGLLALLALGLSIVIRIVRAPPEYACPAGALLALATIHALQPFNIVLTPLLFLSAGLAIPSGAHPVRVRKWITVLLVAATVLAGTRLTASSLERYGSTYDSVTSLTWAGRIDARRLGADEELAYLLAFGADLDEARRAREVLREMVAAHPWHPTVRLIAAEVEVLLNDPAAGRRWLDRHLDIFPVDPLALAGSAAVALRMGDNEEAAAFARRALEIDPDQTIARSVLESATAETPS